MVVMGKMQAGGISSEGTSWFAWARRVERSVSVVNDSMTILNGFVNCARFLSHLYTCMFTHTVIAYFINLGAPNY